MKRINLEALNSQELYKLAIGSVVPRPIAFVTTESENNVLNGAPFSYFNVVSTDPFLLSISISNKDGRLKDTARNIVKHEAFVVHTVTMDNLKQVNLASESLPYGESEIEKVGFTSIKSSVVDVRAIKESPIRFECTLEHTYKIMDESSHKATLFIGRVVAMHVESSLLEEGRILIDKYKPIGRIAGNNYTTIGNIITLERPK